MDSTQLQLHTNGFLSVRKACQNNLRGIDVDIPRNAFVVFTGVSGSGKSSLAFGTIYAEAQRRYFESIAPYARRLIAQLPAPSVGEIRGLPPAVALQQRRVEPTSRSSVGTITTLSNSLRMLFSRGGVYPSDTCERLDSDAFSPNTQAGACEACHGMGVIHTVSEKSLVPDASLSIRERAIAAWPGAWQGKNYRDILAVLGYDVDKPWRDLPEKDRDWILFTKEKPVVTVHAEREAHRIQRPYQGTYMSASSYVLHTFATTNSVTLRKRVSRFMEISPCVQCGGKRLKRESLAVRFAGYDIADLMHMPLSELHQILLEAPSKIVKESKQPKDPLLKASAESELRAVLTAELLDRIQTLSDLGLEYLSLDRSTPSLSAGELQRLRIGTQIRAGLFGVIYVLDEPSAGLHCADSEALIKMLRNLQASGNSLFVVEHDMAIVRQSDWIVDIGPGAGDGGGSLLYSGPVAGLNDAPDSVTRKYLFSEGNKAHGKLSANSVSPKYRTPRAWLKLRGITKHNLRCLDVEFPLGVLCAISGVSGSGKTTLVSRVLAQAVQEKLGAAPDADQDEEIDDSADPSADEASPELSSIADEKDYVAIEFGEEITRLVCVDQKPIGRTPRSNLATYTGLFDHIRKCFAGTSGAKSRGFNASRFSFNVAGGRCESCEGEGFVSIELLFLPRVYAPCGTCKATRYNATTLEVTYRDLNIAQVLDLSVDAACEKFGELPAVARALKTLQDVGLGYLKLGQPATELSGGEAQRIKLATELQRSQSGQSLYILDEPTTGLHAADVERLLKLLHALVDAGNTVVVVEHDIDVIAQADWVIDLALEAEITAAG